MALEWYTGEDVVLEWDPAPERLREEDPMGMSISDAEKRARKHFVEEALANSRIEGHVPSKADIDDWNAYVNGVRSLDETEQRIVERALHGH